MYLYAYVVFNKYPTNLHKLYKISLLTHKICDESSPHYREKIIGESFIDKNYRNPETLYTLYRSPISRICSRSNSSTSASVRACVRSYARVRASGPLHPILTRVRCVRSCTVNGSI